MKSAAAHRHRFGSRRPRLANCFLEIGAEIGERFRASRMRHLLHQRYLEATARTACGLVLAMGE